MFEKSLPFSDWSDSDYLQLSQALEGRDYHTQTLGTADQSASPLCPTRSWKLRQSMWGVIVWRWLETADMALPRANHAQLISWLPMTERLHQGTKESDVTSVKPLILSLPMFLPLNWCGFDGWTIRWQGIVWLQPKSYQCWVVSPQGSVLGPIVFNILIT